MSAILSGGFRCPTCRAAQELGESCRRCKCDLRLVQEVVQTYAWHRGRCFAAIRAGDAPAALSYARNCELLDPSADSLKLLAVSAFLSGNWPLAVDVARRIG
jgi:hypothetical protein